MECNHISVFWQVLKLWTSNIIPYHINFTVLDVLIGIPNYAKDSNIAMLNFIILLTKYYIKKSREQNLRVIFSKFKTLLRDRLEIELYIVKLNKNQSILSVNLDTILSAC